MVAEQPWESDVMATVGVINNSNRSIAPAEPVGRAAVMFLGWAAAAAVCGLVLTGHPAGRKHSYHESLAEASKTPGAALKTGSR